jgi:ferrochelatase
VRETLDRFGEPSASDGRAKVIFTAHSLPRFILERGDPYEHQLHETAQLLASELGLPGDRWQFCYQSAAQTGVPWLGPQIEDLVAQLAQAGERNILVAPIGFIADHVEVLYDIDIGVQAVARSHGVRVERTPMLNDSPALVAALASIAACELERVA